MRRDAEWHDVRRMAVNHGLYVWSCPVNFAMDEALKERALAFGVNWIGVEIVLQDVGRGHELRRNIPRPKIAVGILRMSDRDVAETVEHSLVHQDAVCGHQVFEHGGIHGTGGLRLLLCAGWYARADDECSEQRSSGEYY